MAKKGKKKLRKTHVKAWRKFRGLTQIQLSERVGVAQGTISDLESGTIAYTQSMLEAVAEALNVDPWKLIWHPPEAGEGLRDILEGMDPDEQKRALAVVKALKDSKAA